MSFPDKIIVVLCFFALGTVSSAVADTVYLKNGGEVKGIIVEEYKDRLIISTYEGEKEIFRNHVRKMLYDLPEQNLISLGDTYRARREFEKAYFYYNRAYKANPSYKEARERMSHIQGMLFRQQQEAKLKSINAKQELESFGAAGRKKVSSPAKRLKDCAGFALGEDGNYITVKKVHKDSPAAAAGLKKKDRIVSVWGQLTGYMSKKEVTDLMLEESAGEVKFNVERDIKLKKGKSARAYAGIMGGSLDILIEGITITDIDDGGPGQKAGLAKGDLVVAIDGVQTRYMTLKEVARLIEKSAKSTILFTVKKSMNVWKRR